MKMKMTGKVFRFEDDVNTDYIISSKNKSKILDRKELASHLMEDIRPHFADELNVGDIIVAGENFGCGSSRETAPIVIKEAGLRRWSQSRSPEFFIAIALTLDSPLSHVIRMALRKVKCSRSILKTGSCR